MITIGIIIGIAIYLFGLICLIIRARPTSNYEELKSSIFWVALGLLVGGFLFSISALLEFEDQFRFDRFIQSVLMILWAGSVFRLSGYIGTPVSSIQVSKTSKPSAPLSRKDAVVAKSPTKAVQSESKP